MNWFKQLEIEGQLILALVFAGILILSGIILYEILHTIQISSLVSNPEALKIYLETYNGKR